MADNVIGIRFADRQRHMHGVVSLTDRSTDNSILHHDSSSPCKKTFVFLQGVIMPVNISSLLGDGHKYFRRHLLQFSHLESLVRNHSELDLSHSFFMAFDQQSFTSMFDKVFSSQGEVMVPSSLSFNWPKKLELTTICLKISSFESFLDKTSSFLKDTI